MTHAIIEAAQRFTSRTQVTVSGIMGEGPSFSRSVRRELIVADIAKNGDIANCIGDLIRAAKEAQNTKPAMADYYRIAEEELGKAMIAISNRQIAAIQTQRAK